jgi:hypothetical protein
LRCCEEGSVARGDDEVRVVESSGGREMYRVISAQAVNLGEVAGVLGKCLVQLDEIELLVMVLEPPHRAAELPRREPSVPVCLRESRTGFRIEETNAGDTGRSVPELARGAGSHFHDEQRYERGRVEVDDHLR